MKKLSLMSVVGAVALGVQGHAVFKWQNTSWGNTPATAYDWTDGANWTNNAAPGEGDSVVFPANGGVYYVRMPDDVKVRGVTVHANVRLLGGTMTVTDLGANGRGTLQGNGIIYADVVYNQPGDVQTMHYLADIRLAGRTIAHYGEVISAWSTSQHRLDLYATSSDPLRTDDFQMTKMMHPGSGSVSIYAPSGADEVTSTWSQEAGSPYLTRVSATEHTIAVGTTVTGTGIPAGTFVKRMFTSGAIELSVPVTETAAANALTFAAFTPNVRAHIPNFDRQGMVLTDFKLYKKREQDTFRFEFDRYGEFWGQTNRVGLTNGELANYRPGTHVIHTVYVGAGGAGEEVLQNCHLELAGATDGGATAWPANRPMRFEGAGYAARITVTNGITGSVAVFKGWKGALRKDGGGELTLGLADAVNSGSLELAGGTLVLNRNASVGEAQVSLARVSLAAGSRLQLPAGGLAVGTFTAEEGAIISGPGEVVVELAVGQAFQSGRLVLEQGATVRVHGGQSGCRITAPPTGEVVGHPAFWLDASKPATIEYTTEAGVNYVTRWNDCRAGEPMFCTNLVYRPTFINGDTMAQKYVRLARHGGSEFYTNTEQLVWSVPIKDIRAVFLVQDPTEGGGEILGRCSWRLGNGYYGSRGGPYYRGGSMNWKSALISGNYATESVLNGRFFLNGNEVKGNTTGYLGTYLQLVEHHVNTDYRASGGYKELWCDAFGGGYQENAGGGTFVDYSNGGMRIAEYIIYTNSLTHVERVQVAQYLMAKWLNQNVVYEEWDAAVRKKAADVSAAGERFDVDAGKACVVGDVSGTGALVKTGEGTLYVAALPSGSIAVEQGELLVDSLSMKNTDVPADAWLHVDAADAASLVTTTAGDVTRLSRWNDVRGNGVSLRPLTSNAPAVVADALGGKPVVDLGTVNGADKAALRYYKADGTPYTHNNNGNTGYFEDFKETLKAMFFVFGSKGGGASLLGCWGNGYPSHGFPHQSASPQVPMFYATSYWGMGFDGIAPSISNKTCTVRLNGVGFGERQADGTVFDPFVTPYSGGYDLFSFNWSSGRRSDVFGTYGQDGAYMGGVEFAEILIYTNKLSDAAFAQTEAYLQKKWFNRHTRGMAPAEVTSFSVASGAKATVLDGAITTAALGGGGTVEGEVILAEDGVYVAEIADGALPTLTIDGAFTLPATGTLRITGDVKTLEPGRYTLVSCTGLAANALAGWTVEAPAKPSRTYALTCPAGALVVDVAQAGTMLILR